MRGRGLQIGRLDAAWLHSPRLCRRGRRLRLLLREPQRCRGLGAVGFDLRAQDLALRLGQPRGELHLEVDPQVAVLAGPGLRVRHALALDHVLVPVEGHDVVHDLHGVAVEVRDVLAEPQQRLDERDVRRVAQVRAAVGPEQRVVRGENAELEVDAAAAAVAALCDELLRLVIVCFGEKHVAAVPLREIAVFEDCAVFDDDLCRWSGRDFRTLHRALFSE